MMDWKTRLTLLVVALILAFAARFAAADPVTVTWTNTADSSYPDATVALVCVGQACSMAATECAPGATCETLHDLPPGNYPTAYLMAAAPAEGLGWSVPVPGPLVVEAQEPTGGACRHDADGNGVVTTADFVSFWAEFYGGCGD